MKKKVLCLAMALVMLTGTGLTARAEDHTGQDGWRAMPSLRMLPLCLLHR